METNAELFKNLSNTIFDTLKSANSRSILRPMDRDSYFIYRGYLPKTDFMTKYYPKLLPSLIANSFEVRNGFGKPAVEIKTKTPLLGIFYRVISGEESFYFTSNQEFVRKDFIYKEILEEVSEYKTEVIRGVFAHALLMDDGEIKYNFSIRRMS